MNHIQEALVVEDDFLLRILNRAFLRKLGYKVHMAENGKIACDILAENPNIHTILTDIQMPIMDGYELLKTLYHSKDFKHKELNIIVVSSIEKDEFMSRINFNLNSNHHFLGHFEKPLFFEDLSNVLSPSFKQLSKV